jgi:hypothetical protein
MEKKQKKPFFKRTTVRILLVFVGLLIAVRIALPFIVLHYANDTLEHMKGYYGHIKDVDIALYRGAYKIKNVYLHKVDTTTHVETEFFEVKLVDLSVHWKALFQGKIAGELEFYEPRLKFTKDKVEPKQVVSDSSDFRQLLRDFMPLDVNRFEIRNGVIQYTDLTSKPNVDVQMDNTYVTAENLTNVKDTALLPASVKAEANVYGGILTVAMQLDPLAKRPTFDMNAELKNTNLTEINNFFQAYAKVDVNKGTFGLYTEIASKQGEFVGYVKPIIKDLDVLGKEDRKDNLFQKIWEGLVGAAGVILRNQKHDQVATKVPLQGTFDKTTTNIWYAILEVLRNAFIQALQPSIDHEINIQTVGGPAPGQGDKPLSTGEEPAAKEEKKEGLIKRLFHPKDKKKENEDTKK